MANTQLVYVEDHIWRYDTKTGPRFLVRITVDNDRHEKQGLKTLHKARTHRDGIITKHAVPVPRAKSPYFRDAVQEFLTSCAARRLAPNTLASYTLGLEHLTEAFGGRRCDTLTREEIRLFFEAKLAGTWTPPPGTTTRFAAKKLAFGSVRNHMLVPLNDLFSRLEEEHHVPRNPFRRLAKELGTPADEGLDHVDVDPFTESEVRQILSASRPPKLIPAVTGHRQARIASVEWQLTNVLAGTGMRWGEAAAITVSDLDVPQRRISVSKTVSSRFGIRSLTKGKKSRWVDLTPSLADDLKAYLEWLRLECGAEGQSPVLLFPDRSPMKAGETGPRVSASGERYLAMRSYHRYFWYPLLAAYGLPKKSPHQLRHSYATILIGKGAGIEYVSKQLGHADVTITDRVYNHWKPPVSETRGVDLLEAR